MMGNWIIYVSLFFFTICKALPDNEREENTIQTILEENMLLKERHDVLQDRLDTLQDRFTALEKMCTSSIEQLLGLNNGKVLKYAEPLSSDNDQSGETEVKEDHVTDEMITETKPETRGQIIQSNLAFGQEHLLKRVSDSEVAFHVYLSGNRCYSNHEIFKFDEVKVNVGNGFNVNDGIFDAPATGIYVFSWTVAASHGTYFAAELIINGAVQGVIESDSDLGGPGVGIHPATGVVLANVNVKNHVYIRFIVGDNCVVVSDAMSRSSFTGWLLM